MLQIALLLVELALSLYLWTISRPIPYVIGTFTLFGVTSYTFFTFAVTFDRNCPHHTLPSTVVRAPIKHLARGGSILFTTVRSQ